MKFVDLMSRIDRRIIYLILALVVILPLIIPSAQHVRVMMPVQKLFSAVDTIHNDKVLMIDFDYDPQTQPELEPMALAILRHAFEKRIKVLGLSLYVQPLGLAKSALD
jgi:ABC-type cobalt transport system substrate-binding protein